MMTLEGFKGLLKTKPELALVMVSPMATLTTAAITDGPGTDYTLTVT